MTHHGRFVPRLTALPALLAGLLSIAVATRATAAPTTDPRWLPWIGCWTPISATSDIATTLAGTQRVCVIPSGETGVDVVSAAGGQVLSRTHVDATGERRPVSREGCAGWETARWAAAAGRVYLRSELVCAGGIERVSTGILAIASPSDWVDVEVVGVRDQHSTRIVRYRSAPDTTAIGREIASALGDQELARRAARMAASGMPTIADVVEASREVEPATIEAWLLQRMPRFAVDASQLRKLASAHVPAPVIDLVVMLSSPEMFPGRLVARGYTIVRLDPPRASVVAVEPESQADRVNAPVIQLQGGSYEDRSSYGRRCDRCNEPDVIYYDPTPNAPYGYYPYWPYGAYPSYPYYPYYPSTPHPQPPPPTRPPARPSVSVPGPSYPKPPVTQPPAPAPEPVNGRAVYGTGYTRSTGETAAEPTTATQATPAPVYRPAPQQEPPPQEPPRQEPPRQAEPRQAQPRQIPESQPAPPPAYVPAPEPRAVPQPLPAPVNQPTATPAPAPTPTPPPPPPPTTEPPPRTAKVRPPAID